MLVHPRASRHNGTGGLNGFGCKGSHSPEYHTTQSQVAIPKPSLHPRRPADVSIEVGRCQNRDEPVTELPVPSTTALNEDSGTNFRTV